MVFKAERVLNFFERHPIPILALVCTAVLFYFEYYQAVEIILVLLVLYFLSRRDTRKFRNDFLLPWLSENNLVLTSLRTSKIREMLLPYKYWNPFDNRANYEIFCVEATDSKNKLRKFWFAVPTFAAEPKGIKRQVEVMEENLISQAGSEKYSKIPFIPPNIDCRPSSAAQSKPR